MEDLDRARLEERLIARFVPPLESAEVHRAIDDAVAMFATAPVRNFVALLVERVASDRLRTAASRAEEAMREPQHQPVDARVERPVFTSVS